MRPVITKHKALRCVGGVPLIKRNLQRLLGFGFGRIYVAVNEVESELVEWICDEGLLIARLAGAHLELIKETEPLGTIGAAALLPSFAQNVIVVNVDNLTSLNLRLFAQFHLQTHACATLAIHDEPICSSFGQVLTDGERLINYIEKPRIPLLISSGVYALSRCAIGHIIPGTRTDIPFLYRRLTEFGENVLCFRHESLWIDINDEVALARAEQMFH